MESKRPVEVAQVVQAAREGLERVGLLGPGADRAGDRDRLLADWDGLLGPQGEHQHKAVAGEHAGAFG